MAAANVNLKVYPAGANIAAAGSVAINPNAPIGAAIASAMPSLAAASASAPLPVNLAPVPAPILSSPLASPGLRVLREGRLISLDPSKTAEQQHIKSGDNLLLQTTPLTNDELLTTLLVQRVEQGNLETAFADLRVMVSEGHDFKERGRALGFILSAFALLILFSLGMLIADGMATSGFHLTTFVRNSLVTSVLGEVAALVAIAFRFLFRIPGSTSPAHGRPSTSTSPSHVERLPT